MHETPAEPPIAAGAVIPFAGGMLAGGLHQPGAVGALLAAALALGLMRRMRGRMTRVRVAALAAGIACGAFAAAWEHRMLPPDHVARYAGTAMIAVEGRVVQTSAARSGVQIVVEATRVRTRRGLRPVRGLLAVTIAHAVRSWPLGSTLRVVGTLRRPRNFANPGAYDHVRALARRGIRATLFLWSDEHVALLTPAPGGLDRVVDRWRTAAAERISARTTEPVRGYLLAVLLGAGQSLEIDTRDGLTRTGLAHVVSVSGFHVAVTAAACVFLVHWVLLRVPRLALRVDVTKVAALIGVVPVGAYAAIAGGSVPATRAFVTYAVVLAALACDRPPDGMRALALAAILLAIPAPDIAADVSFGLSFVSVAALIAADRRARRERPPTRALRWWRQVVVAPVRTAIAVTLATAPLTAWHFQQVSLIAPVANLVGLPLLGPATLLPGLAALPCAGLVPALADRLLDVAGLAASAGLTLAAVLARVPWAAVATPMPSLFELGLAYVGLALWWARPREASRPAAHLYRLAVAALVIVATADVAGWIWERHANPTLRITFLSVGQGDAAVVELPHGGTLVVDGGGLPGDFDPGERVIAPFLRRRKILRLDLLVLSHPQLDHYGGLVHLAERFRPRAFWSNGTRGNGERYARLEATLATAGAESLVLRRGMTQRLESGVVVEVLHPDAVDGIGVNDASLVFRLRFGATAVLFTGDVEHGAERVLLGDPARLQSDVLKVPHHGSATSSTARWLAAVAPRVAVISSGAGNRFGFPARDVVRRLRAAGASVWNTAEHGAVRVVSDGRAIQVTSMPSSAAQRFEFPQLLW